MVSTNDIISIRHILISGTLDKEPRDSRGCTGQEALKDIPRGKYELTDVCFKIQISNGIVKF